MNSFQGVQITTVPVPSQANAVPMPAFGLSTLDKTAIAPSSNNGQLQKPMTTHQMFVTELPEMIFVETRFISHQVALEQGLLTAVSLQGITSESEVEQVVPEIISQKQSSTQIADVAVMAKASVADESTLTDNPNPTRDRAQQTDTMVESTITIGIQCNMEDEAAFEAEFSEEESSDPRREFREFALEKSYAHSNGKQECLLCGEIKNNEERMMLHMTLHWGPPGLCENCGQHFEHYKMLGTHICATNVSVKQEKRKDRLQCPLYYCGTMMGSKVELHDHINEHLRLYRYRCSGCRRRFMTLDEMRKHRQFGKKCSKFELRISVSHVQQKRIYKERIYVAHTLSRKRVLIKSRVKCSSILWRCQICRWRCKSSTNFAKHLAICVKHFAARRKRYTLALLPVTKVVNGH